MVRYNKLTLDKVNLSDVTHLTSGTYHTQPLFISILLDMICIYIIVNIDYIRPNGTEGQRLTDRDSCEFDFHSGGMIIFSLFSFSALIDEAQR